MLSQSSTLTHLPEELWVSIFEKAGSHPSLCSVSKDVQRIMETVYACLYRDYQGLNSPYLNQILQQVDQSQAEMPALAKVRLVYEAVMRGIEQLPEEIKQAILARHTEALSLQRMEELAVYYEASSLIACFERIAQDCPEAQQFLAHLPKEDKINQANRIRTWMRENAQVLQQVTYLNLNSLKLTHLPAEIVNLTHLQHLDLNHNQFTSLPAAIGNIAQLQHLDLNHNQLTSLPAEIDNLTQLQVLNLGNNRLTSLPQEIGKLAQLQILNLNNNQLTSLPAAIGNLAQLRGLRLTNNQLTSLPAEIVNLTQLQHLYIANNQLTSLPTAIDNLNQLQDLNLNVTVHGVHQKFN